MTVTSNFRSTVVPGAVPPASSARASVVLMAVSSARLQAPAAWTGRRGHGKRPLVAGAGAAPGDLAPGFPGWQARVRCGSGVGGGAWVEMPWFPDFAGALELARRDAR